MKKKIITMGTALALALSMGMTVSAGHHGACAGSVIQGSGLRQYRGSHEGGHHLYCYGGGQDCAYWGIDVSGVCDYWEYCHGGAAYGTQGGIGRWGRPFPQTWWRYCSPSLNRLCRYW